jgi:hypothetical protein
MKPSLIYTVAAVLLVLFAVGHTLGFSQTDPKWGVDNVLGPMHSLRFEIGGFRRTLWDFYMGAGLTVGVFFLFAAVLAWQLGRLSPETLAQMRILPWAFALAFAGVTAVSFMYLFIIPIAFSTVITLCLVAAAVQSAR